MIRIPTIADSLAIKELIERELDYMINEEILLAQLRTILQDVAHHIIYVYEDIETHKVEGFVHGQLYDTLLTSSALNILELAVCSTMQGQGIGRKLMRSVEQEAKMRRLKVIRLNSSEKRLSAHKFYENIGYEGSKVQKRFIKYIED